MTGEVFDIKRYAVHDGPGVRCTAFFKGCPLGCVWCHNPEGKRPGAEICCQPSACIGCGACAAACPAGAVTAEGTGVDIDRERCTRCGACAAVCRAGALTLKGAEISAEALVEELGKDEVFFQTSGGGVTLSGGDPLFQPAFARAVLLGAKARGYHTAVETSLYASTDTVESLLEAVDYWLCDLKILDDAAHRRLTGCPNGPILDNYALLASRGCAMRTRIPVIPGCTDSRENLTAIGRHIARVNPKGEVELMFYNPLGESKYRSYGMDYALTDARSYTEEQKNTFREMVAATGVAAVL